MKNSPGPLSTLPPSTPHGDALILAGHLIAQAELNTSSRLPWADAHEVAVGLLAAAHRAPATPLYEASRLIAGANLRLVTAADAETQARWKLIVEQLAILLRADLRNLGPIAAADGRVTLEDIHEHP